MTTVSRAAVLNQLKHIKGAGMAGDIVSLGLVSEIFIAEAKVFFSITVPAEQAEACEPLRREAENAVRALDGVKAAIVSLTAERKQQTHARPPAAAPAAQPHGRRSVAPRTPLADVKHIIAVASGKGGVGKSTTAINLAIAMQQAGLAVGLLDADIYGPSLPRLAALHARPEVVDKKLKPMEKFGLKLMSMGFMVDEETPMVWRGPMVMTAVTQMLRDVLWAPLDVLVVDMPPGTGDAQLTLAQQVPLSGSVIVSTPQDLALVDARKGIEMFTKVGVPILGIVENMSYFIAPDTGRRYDIFGHGGARREAESRCVPFLGEVPLDPCIRAASDEGKPVILSEPAGDHARRYRDIAQRVIEKLAAEPVSNSLKDDKLIKNISGQGSVAGH